MVNNFQNCRTRVLLSYLYSFIGLTLFLILSACSSGNSLKPAAATTQQNFNIQLRLKATPENMPALQCAAISAVSGNRILMIGGMTGGMHAFESFNQTIYVYDIDKNKLYSQALSNTDLPAAVKSQFSSECFANFLVGDYEYIIGGYNAIDPNHIFTNQMITSVDTARIADAIVSGSTTLAQYIHYNQDYPAFKVTGGSLYHIGDDFYLGFGQNCEGLYCSSLQVYTQRVIKFSTDSNLENIQFIKTVFNDDESSSGFRRRDYNLVAFETENSYKLLALGGPFTPGNFAEVWTNIINFDPELNYNLDFYPAQAFNQYNTANLVLNDQNAKQDYVILFAGMSNTYWSSNRQFVVDSSTPLSNVMSMLAYNYQTNQISEYANSQPLYATINDQNYYMGGNSQFIQNANLSGFNDDHTLNIANLHQASLIGYIYGGLLAESNTIFPPPTVSFPSNQLYEVYYLPAKDNSNWISYPSYK